MLEVVVLCSTPFGIIGIHTMGSYFTTTKESGAQRLSASSEFTHSDLYNEIQKALSAQRLSASSEFTLVHIKIQTGIIQCSTPFGIIGIHTSKSRTWK